MFHKLGKKPARRDPRTLMLSNYLVRAKLPPPGKSDDYFTAVDKQGAPWGMLGNGPDPGNPRQIPNGCGDCFWAMGAHAFRTWNANAGRLVNFTTQSVIDAYSACTGFDLNKYDPNDSRTDPGTDMLSGLSFLRQTGMVDSTGKVHKIGPYMQVNHQSFLEIKSALDLFGEVLIGVRFPQEWMDNKVWGPTNSPIEGGHAINGGRRDLKDAPVRGVNIATWGADDRWIAYTAFNSFVDELYVTVPPDWIADNGKAPNGFDLPTLLADLAIVTA